MVEMVKLGLRQEDGHGVLLRFIYTGMVSISCFFAYSKELFATFIGGHSQSPVGTGPEAASTSRRSTPSATMPSSDRSSTSRSATPYLRGLQRPPLADPASAVAQDSNLEGSTERLRPYCSPLGGRGSKSRLCREGQRRGGLSWIPVLGVLVLPHLL